MLRGPRGLGFLVALSCCLAPACSPGSAATRTPKSAQESRADPQREATDPQAAQTRGSGERGDSSEAAKPARPPYTPPSTLGEPLEFRQAGRTRLVYADPNKDSPRRGRIPRKQRFAVYAHREAEGCDAPWGQVADAAWVCLERAEPSKRAPVDLPVLEDGAIVPYLYARHEHHDKPSTAPIPVYRSLRQMNAGADPVDELAAYGSYAFVRHKRNRGRPAYITKTRRAVPAKQLEEFKPSEFAGRELDERPVPEGRQLAWAIRWKTLARVAPDLDADERLRVPYHDEIDVNPKPVLDDEGERWFEVLAVAGEAVEGPAWIAEDDIRRWIPKPPSEPILADQLLIDIDLDQQVLTLWREDRPLLATLVSSGKPGDRTPPGLYRIESKWAYGKMRSLPEAEDPYYVEAVPWAMYFSGRYALHASYWHDLFGHRASHGCVNLSPRDARRVFELSTPTLPAGWQLVNEHAADPGALVRVRRSGAELPDRRAKLPGADARK